MDEVNKKIIPFNSLEFEVAKTLIRTPFSFSPKVHIQGMNYIEEEEFFETCEKYKVDTSEMNLIVYSDVARNPILEEDDEVLEHYNKLLTSCNLVYNNEYAFRSNDKFVFFNDITKFSSII